MPTKNPKDQNAIEKLGRKVRFLREGKGLTIMKLAEDCEVEYTTISKIERGLNNTTISMISKIAKALKVHPTELLAD